MLAMRAYVRPAPTNRIEYDYLSTVGPTPENSSKHLKPGRCRGDSVIRGGFWWLEVEASSIKSKVEGYGAPRICEVWEFSRHGPLAELDADADRMSVELG